MDDSAVRQRLEQALRQALRARSAVEVSALRSALAAIDNAGAIAVGPASAAGASSPHFAGAAAGLGAAEVPRRGLSEGEIEEIVRAEAAERRDAAHRYERSGRVDHADRLRREASVLESAVDPGEGHRTGR